MSRENDYATRLLALQDEFDDVSSPIRAKIALTVAVALIDGYCLVHAERRASEDEFVSIARDIYRKSRELVPLVKTAPPGQN